MSNQKKNGGLAAAPPVPFDSAADREQPHVEEHIRQQIARSAAQPSTGLTKADLEDPDFVFSPPDNS